MLNKETIIQYLDSIHEHTMAKEIFVPIFKKMGLKGVKFTGGSLEEGIDIEYYELTQPEQNRSYVGIQFKKGDITYSSRGKNNTVKEVKNQAEEAFEKEIHDVEGRFMGYIGRFIVALTGDINEPARKMIGKARLKGQDRRIDYWQGERLAEYIIDYWKEEFIDYFNIEEAEEDFEEEIQIVDKEFISENYSDDISSIQKLKSITSSLEYNILLSIAELEYENDSAPTVDLLFSLGKSEEYIFTELKHLIELNLVAYDEEKNEWILQSKAVVLIDLLCNISEELVGAEEDADPKVIFREVTK